MSNEVKYANRQLHWLADITPALHENGEDRESRVHTRKIAALGEESERLAMKLTRRQERLTREARELLEDLRLEEGRPLPDRPAPAPPRCSIELVGSPAGPCVPCAEEVGSGLLGWRREPDPGPLCPECLAHHHPELGAVLTAVQCMRHLVFQSEQQEDDRDSALAPLLELARGYARATAGAWPARSTGLEPLLKEVTDRMEELHGRFWLDEPERKRDEGSEPN